MYSSDFINLALKLYDKLKSLRKVSFITETSHSTISRWYNYKFKPRKETIKKLEKPDIINSIAAFILAKPFCSIKDIKEMVYKIFNVNASNELIRLCIIKNKFTKKRARYFSEPKNDKEKLKEFLDKRQEYINDNRNFVSIDETSFGRNYLPTIGYSKKGIRFYVKRPFSRITTHSVVAVVSLNEPLVFCKKQGSFNTESYYDFLNSLNLPSKTVLLMDNVRFHHSKIIKELASLKGWDLLYVPPYSPIFNPVEGVFSIVKRHYQKFLNIEEAFRSVSNDNIKSFFRYSFNAISRF